MKKIVKPENMPKTVGYSRAIRVDNLMFICAQEPKDSKGNIVEGDFETQARQVFENMRDVVKAEGGTMENIVEITAYMTNMNDVDVFRKIRAEYFKDYYPVCSMVEVKRLLSEKYLIVVKGIAAF
jgi:2-iminobutanoate/2-iminopropanoate deaminase